MFIFSITTVFAAPWQSSVKIINEGKESIVYTDEVSIRDIIKSQNIALGENDVVYPNINSSLTDEKVITIKHIKRVDVEFGGKLLSYWTDADTFGEFIKKGTVGADDDDIYSVSLDTKLEDCVNKLSIVKVDKVTEYINEEVMYETNTIYDDTKQKGIKDIVTKGENGVKTYTYEVLYHDGKKIETKLVKEEITKAPVNEVVSEGTFDQSIVVNGEVINYRKVLTCQATAYDLSFESCGKYPGHPAYGITASGTYAKVGTVAVDPRVIPLGTKMYIVSVDGSYVYGYCTAEDTGGAIKGNKVDLFYNTKSECMQFGRRNVKVYIL